MHYIVQYSESATALREHTVQYYSIEMTSFISMLIAVAKHQVFNQEQLLSGVSNCSTACVGVGGLSRNGKLN
jgi:hypothetical protein